MIAFPSENGGLAERDPSELDLEHSKADITLVRATCRRGLLTPERMQMLADRLEDIAQTAEEPRIRVAADKALVSMQAAMIRALVDTSRGSGGDSAQSVTNQQINIYLPSNGREVTNGNGNGKH